MRIIPLAGNPIFRVEYTCIRRQEARGKYRRLNRQVLLLLAALTLIPFAARLMYVPLADFFAGTIVMPGVVAFIPLASFAAVYLVVSARALLRGFQSIGRERASLQQWELFILTGVDARKAITGKWAAVVLSLWPDMLALAVIRAVLMVGLSAFEAASSLHTATYVSNPASRWPEPSLERLLFVLLGLVLLTPLHLLFMAACGVLAGMTTARPSSSAVHALARWFLIALVVSFVFLIMTFLASQYALYLYRTGFAPDALFSPPFINIYNVNLMAAFTMIDNGALTLFIITFGALYPEAEYWAGIVAVVLLPLLYVALTWVLLRLSRVFAARGGMV